MLASEACNDLSNNVCRRVEDDNFQSIIIRPFLPPCVAMVPHPPHPGMNLLIVPLKSYEDDYVAQIHTP